MHPELQEICDLLDDLSKTVLNGWAEDRDFSEIYGWNWPSVSRHSLANIPAILSGKIKQNPVTALDPELEDNVTEAIGNLKNLKAQTVPYLYNGNGNVAVPLYITTLSSVEHLLNSLFEWKSISDNKLLPPAMSRRLRAIDADLNEITPSKDDLKRQIDLIKEATEAAGDLPVDLASLRESRTKIEKINADSAGLFGKIEVYNQQVEAKVKSLNKASDDIIDAIRSKKAEADDLVKKSEEAYRITTSTGLAGAFDERADKSANAVIVWSVCLVIGLGLSAFTGSNRVSALSTLINVSNPQWGVISLNIVLSILSVGAPIWFAWLATKQINQRFRLSEDYAFKASVAKAYEGYRREAARIDPILEARLFSSALTRLEEAPLRFVSDDIHGSPWQELFASQPFQKALDTIPGLKDTMIQLFREKIPSLDSFTFDNLKSVISNSENKKTTPADNSPDI